MESSSIINRRGVNLKSLMFLLGSDQQEWMTSQLPRVSYQIQLLRQPDDFLYIWHSGQQTAQQQINRTVYEFKETNSEGNKKTVSCYKWSRHQLGILCLKHSTETSLETLEWFYQQHTNCWTSFIKSQHPRSTFTRLPCVTWLFSLVGISHRLQTTVTIEELIFDSGSLRSRGHRQRL